MLRHGTSSTVRWAAAMLAALGGAGGAGAMPVVVPVPAAPPGAAIEPAANGCGPGYFRTLAGECFPNQRFVGPRGGVRAPPPCPPGYLRAPDRPLCFPVQ